MNTTRRALIGRAAGLGAAAALPGALLAQTSTPTKAARRFDPEPGDWRTFEVTTRIDLPATTSATRVWVPLPSVQTPWQQTLGHTFSSNGQARLASDGAQGVRMVAAEFAPGAAQPFVEVTSRVRTQSRDESQARRRAAEDSATLREALKPTRLLPTDGIVRDTARQATRGARGDEAKARAIYDWVVANAYREPKVRGCGEGDIKTMLETGNLGGKCADLNALFVGLCRSVGLPARDVYGIRLAPSAFGYRELGGNPTSLKGAQHCRAEVYLQARGWTAMDPAGGQPDREAGVRVPVRRLGRQLDGLQHRARRAVAGRAGGRAGLFHVPGGRERRWALRQLRPGRFQVPDHGAAGRCMTIDSIAAVACLASARRGFDL